MSRDTTGKVCHQSGAASSHQPELFHPKFRDHQPFHLDDELYYDLDRRRKHAELVDFSITGYYKVTFWMRNVQCIKKRSTAREVRSALGSTIFEHCNPTVIQSQVPEATIQGFLNIGRIMPCLSAMVSFQFTGSGQSSRLVRPYSFVVTNISSRSMPLSWIASPTSFSFP